MHKQGGIEKAIISRINAEVYQKEFIRILHNGSEIKINPFLNKLIFRITIIILIT